MPKLVIKEGPGKGDAFQLSAGEVTIGRDPENAFRVADRTVSRYHARIAREEGDCCVHDLGSQNGTLVNGERVRTQKLLHMDEIRLGNVVLIFLEDDVTDIDLLVQSEDTEPEITQAIDVDEALAMEGVAEGSRSELITSNQRLLALTELSQDAGTVRSLPSLFDHVIDSVHRTLDPDRVVPIICEEDGTLLPYIRAKSGFGRGIEAAGISKKLVEHTLKKEVAAVSRLVSAKQADAGKAPGEGQRITSAMCCPLVQAPDESGAGKTVHGVLYCDRLDRAARYQRTDLQYLCLIAAQTAVAIQNIHAYEAMAARARTLELEIEGQYDLVGQSAQIKAVFEFIRKAAPTNASVLICGESGTGKELVARAIHYNSKCSAGPFEAVNCAAMSQTLIESELFGHVKGSFTSAIADRPGRFELADKGTIFLDEIGALPLDCQTKLLRVLETGAVRRVGDVKDRTVDVRVIAATNEDLDKAKTEQRFREDLFYRLDVLRTTLPPLRERGADIELLAQHFLREFAEKTGRTIRGFAPAVIAVFRSYRWPGNVRELRNMIERMVILCEENVLGPDMLPADLRGATGAAADPAAPRSPDSLQSLEEVEKRYILDVLRKTGGNKKKTAEILGLDRSTLYAKLRRYGTQ